MKKQFAVPTPRECSGEDFGLADAVVICTSERIRDAARRSSRKDCKESVHLPEIFVWLNENAPLPLIPLRTLSSAQILGTPPAHVSRVRDAIIAELERRIIPSISRSSAKYAVDSNELSWHVRRVRLRVHSTLAVELRSRHKKSRSPASQWLNTIANLPRVSSDEKRFSGAEWWLSCSKEGRRLSCDQVTLGILRNLQLLQPSLYCLTNRRYEPSTVPRTDNTPAPIALRRRLGRWASDLCSAYVHPAFNYRILFADFQDMLGSWRFWLVVDEKWRPIGGHPASVYPTLSRAMSEMQQAIESRFEGLKKVHDVANWQSYTVPGSMQYQEWLLALDNLPPAFRYPHHYDFHNVLLHLRTSRRRCQNGRKILFLEELQSDVIQKRRGRGNAYIDSPFGARIELPWQNSWYTLGINVLLWIAASHGYEGVAIAPGFEQAARYGDYFGDGGVNLYDKTLVSTLSDIARQWDSDLQKMRFGIELPDLVTVQQTHGYMITDAHGMPIFAGIKSLDAARIRMESLVHGTHMEAKGLTFTPELHQQIRRNGIPIFGKMRPI